MPTTYADTIRHLTKRAEERLKLQAEQAQEARLIAEKLARLLRDQFQAKRVVLIGSVARGQVHEGSDIDLVVHGIPDEQLLRAKEAAFEAAMPLYVDVLAWERLTPSWQERVNRDGIELL